MQLFCQIQVLLEVLKTWAILHSHRNALITFPIFICFDGEIAEHLATSTSALKVVDYNGGTHLPRQNLTLDVKF